MGGIVLSLFFFSFFFSAKLNKELPTQKHLIDQPKMPLREVERVKFPEVRTIYSFGRTDLPIQSVTDLYFAQQTSSVPVGSLGVPTHVL